MADVVPQEDPKQSQNALASLMLEAVFAPIVENFQLQKRDLEFLSAEYFGRAIVHDFLDKGHDVGISG